MRMRIKPHASILHIVITRDEPSGAFVKGEEGTAIALVPSSGFEYLVTLDGYYKREFQGHTFLASRRFYMNQKNNFYFVEQHQKQKNVLKRRIVSNDQQSQGAFDTKLDGK